MLVLAEPLEFEWDAGNKNKNFLKHNVSMQEAEEVFFNEPLLISQDMSHSLQEQRFVALGRTNNSRRLFLSFTIRNYKVRVISVRDMSKKERSTYEQS